MITKLSIKNFRGIEKGELELAPLTILIGGNNSGKSAILEALFLAPNPFRSVPYVINGYTAVELLHEMHRTVISEEGYAFLLYNYTANRAEIGCEVDGKDYTLLFNKKDTSITVYTKKQGREENIGEMDMSSSSIYGKEQKTFIDNTLLISLKLTKSGYQYLYWSQNSIRKEICKKVAEDISKLVYENYRNITIEPSFSGGMAIYGVLEDGRMIRICDLGEGVQNHIIARILYELENPKALLWDDIETHLDPRMLLDIAGWIFDILESGNQVVVTTYSLDAVRTIAGINDEKTAIYLTSLEKGALKTKKLTLKEIEEFSEAGIDVRVVEPLLL